MAASFQSSQPFGSQQVGALSELTPSTSSSSPTGTKTPIATPNRS